MKLLKAVNLFIVLIGINFQASALINGHIVNAGEFPAKSTVMLIWVGHFYCSGTLVGEDLVLTAGHCLNGETPEEINIPENLIVYFGNSENRVLIPELSRKALAIQRHPEFNKVDSNYHDIALVKFAGAIPNAFSPVEILDSSIRVNSEASLLLAGYGISVSLTDPDAGKMKLLRTFPARVKNPISPINGMMELYQDTELVAKFGVVIPKTPGHPELDGVGGMAAGDSGGPAYYFTNNRVYVAGVASGYRDINELEIPFYESVQTHRNWLIETAKKMNSTLFHQ